MKKKIHLPAMRSTARSAGSNWSMLSGLSFAQSLRLWSESKSMTIGFQATHRPQAVTDPSTANTLYTQVGIGWSCGNRIEALAAKILANSKIWFKFCITKKKKKKFDKNLWDLRGNSRILRDPTIRCSHSYLSVARRPRRREDTMILMRILRFNDHGRGTLDGRGADWEVVTGGLGDRGSRWHGCLSLSTRWQKKKKNNSGQRETEPERWQWRSTCCKRWDEVHDPANVPRRKKNII